MVDTVEALFVVELPAGTKEIPVEEALISVQRARGYAKGYAECQDGNLDNIGLFIHMGLPDIKQFLEEKFDSGQVQIFNELTGLPLGPVHCPHFSDGVITIAELRKFVAFMSGAVEVSPVLPSPALGEANAETSSVDAAAPDIEKDSCAGKANNWDEYNLRRLWDEYKEPGMTHQKLAAKYTVTRQRISSLLRKAKQQFGPRKADPFSQLNPDKRKK